MVGRESVIKLHSDCLIFQTSDGKNFPHLAYLVTVELLSNSSVDPEHARKASDEVVRYFRDELKRELEPIPIPEFTEQLRRVLGGFGYKFMLDDSDAPESLTTETPPLPVVYLLIGHNFSYARFICLRP